MKEWKIDPTRIATLLGYPPAMVQAVAARLYQARISEEDEVRSEKWFDPETGGVAFVADLMCRRGLTDSPVVGGNATMRFPRDRHPACLTACSLVYELPTVPVCDCANFQRLCDLF
jgi:hypothetical protein